MSSASSSKFLRLTWLCSTSLPHTPALPHESHPSLHANRNPQINPLSPLPPPLATPVQHDLPSERTGKSSTHAKWVKAKWTSGCTPSSPLYPACSSCKATAAKRGGGGQQERLCDMAQVSSIASAPILALTKRELPQPATLFSLQFSVLSSTRHGLSSLDWLKDSGERECFAGGNCMRTMMDCSSITELMNIALQQSHLSWRRF